MEEVLTQAYNLIYTTTLGGKTLHLFWVKAPLSQGRPALLCSKTAWQISHKNEWFDIFFFHFCDFFPIGTFFSNLLHTFELK